MHGWTVGEHLEVGVEMPCSIGVTRVRGEVDAGVDALQLDLDAQLLPASLDDFLGFLAQRVDRGLVEDGHLLASLLAGAAVQFPVGGVEQRVGPSNIELDGGVLRRERWWQRQQIRRRDTGWAVQLIRDGFTVTGQHEGRAHVFVEQKRVLRRRLGFGAADVGGGIGEVD